MLPVVHSAKPTDATCFSTLECPLGSLLALGDTDSRLIGLYFINGRTTPSIAPDWVRNEDAFGGLGRQLDAYFAGELTNFNLPVLMKGSAFQQRVWTALRTIPYGQTVSYGELARRLGNPFAARAVGLANARNPISIIVPCHRVLGTDGALVGYAGGHHRKQSLLTHEAPGSQPTKGDTHARSTGSNAVQSLPT
jgi:methylated-DNA-[protein]-cysteine S-methyltransferase